MTVKPQDIGTVIMTGADRIPAIPIHDSCLIIPAAMRTLKQKENQNARDLLD